MYGNYEKREQTAPSMMQLRKEFVFRLSQFILNKGQFSVVEDLPVTKPVRMATRLTKSGKEYEVYLIKIESGGFEGDLELFKTELTHLAIVFPEGIANYKGSTLAYDGTRWIYISGQMPTPDVQPVRAPAVDQIDMYMEQLVRDMKTNDIKNSGSDLHTLLNICKSITSGDALELISYAKKKGAIYEQGGLYKTA